MLWLLTMATVLHYKPTKHPGAKEYMTFSFSVSNLSQGSCIYPIYTAHPCQVLFCAQIDSNLCRNILKCLSPVQEYIFFRSSVNAFLMASRLIFIAAVTNPVSGVQGSGSSFTLVGISNLSSFPCLATC